jgi:hypothetical protein
VADISRRHSSGRSDPTAVPGRCRRPDPQGFGNVDTRLCGSWRRAGAPSHATQVAIAAAVAALVVGTTVGLMALTGRSSGTGLLAQRAGASVEARHRRRPIRRFKTSVRHCKSRGSWRARPTGARAAPRRTAFAAQENSLTNATGVRALSCWLRSCAHRRSRDRDVYGEGVDVVGVIDVFSSSRE